MQQLYARLEAFGIPRSYALAVALPPGWRDSDTVNPAVYSQALGLLAQNLNLSLSTLQNDTVPLEWQDCGVALFKRNQTLSDEELTTAKCLAIRAAQVACQAMRTPATKIPESGAAIREAILNKGHLYVSFDALLDYCWNNGLPVLHISPFPKGACKVDPGFVALNYADTRRFVAENATGHYAVGNKALREIEPNVNPVAAIHQRMCERLDWEEIGRDSRHFLRRIAEMQAP